MKTPRTGYRRGAGRGAWLVTVAALLPTAPLSAQAPATISGTVRDPAGHPLAAADAFLLETLEGALTDSAGAFAFTTTATAPLTLVVHKPGYIQLRRTLDAPPAVSLAIVLQPAPIVLEPITVQAGTFRLGSLPDVTLDDLDIVRTPGAAADPFRAIQTFPGVQPVGEGAGLFVRGGDASETRVLLDGATVLSPLRLDNDETVSFGRFDPFQLRGVSFSAGGFGAEHGNALSAIADLQTVDRPAENEFGATGAVGGVSTGANLRLSRSAGVRATVTRNDYGLLMRLSGRKDEFEQAPASADVSGGGEWAYRAGGRLKAFAMVQTDKVGVHLEEPTGARVFRADARADLIAVSGLDAFGRIGVAWGLATSGARKDEGFGVFRLERTERLNQARVKVEVPVGRGLGLVAGGEVEDHRADIAGSHPVAWHDNAPGAPAISFARRESGARVGGFGELQVQPSNTLRFLLGLRADHSSLTGRATADPRLSATYRPAEHLTLTAAWGVFHQIPDPLVFQRPGIANRTEASRGKPPAAGPPATGAQPSAADPQSSGSTPATGARSLATDPWLPPMSAQHWIAGLSYDISSYILRIEIYKKLYENLVSQTRNRVTRGGGTGAATGVDLFAKGRIPRIGLNGRVAYSFIDSERTDPDSGRTAPSPFDATHTLNLVVDRGFRGWLETGLAWRASTGAPFTPVDGADFDPARGAWIPVYGAPMSERFPWYSRVDASLIARHSFAPDNMTVFFVSIMNVLGRPNVSDHHYSHDYSERIPGTTPFPRLVYFGIMTSLPF